MGNNQIKTCYIDDIIDTELSQFLKLYEGIHNKDLVPDENDNAASLINKIVEGGYNIVILDSDLANGANPLITTGQQLELLLTRRYPFIFVILITSHKEKIYDRYIHKFSSREARKTGKSGFDYYTEVLKPILDFAIEKHKRNLSSLETELSEEKGVNASEKTQIVSSFKGEERIVLTKKDLDTIIDKFREIEEKIDENK